MVLSKEGTLYRHKQGQLLLYIPADMANDSQFPFGKLEKGSSQKVMIHVSTHQGLLIVGKVESETR